MSPSSAHLPSPHPCPHSCPHSFRGHCTLGIIACDDSPLKLCCTTWKWKPRTISWIAVENYIFGITDWLPSWRAKSHKNSGTRTHTRTISYVELSDDDDDEGAFILCLSWCAWLMMHDMDWMSWGVVRGKCGCGLGVDWGTWREDVSSARGETV